MDIECDWCGASGAQVSCPRCKVTWYCNERCRNLDDTVGLHSVECAHLKEMMAEAVRREAEHVGMRVSDNDLKKASEITPSERREVIPADLIEEFKGISLFLVTKPKIAKWELKKGHFIVHRDAIYFIDKMRENRSKNMEKLAELLKSKGRYLLNKHAKRVGVRVSQEELTGVHLSSSEIDTADMIKGVDREQLLKDVPRADEIDDDVNFWVLTRRGFLTSVSAGMMGHYEVRVKNVYFVDKPRSRDEALIRFHKMLMIKSGNILDEIEKQTEKQEAKKEKEKKK